MGFFDLFKPRWRHSDAQVRAEAVKQLGGEDDAALLERIARKDADARVRRIALKKISNPRLLAELAERDPDESLRRDAGEKAADLLVAAAVGATDEERGREALGRLTHQRALAEVARRAQLASLRLAALERIVDGKALAEVARKGGDARVRLEAVTRLDDPSALRDVAIDDESKEVALAAARRLEDRAALEAVVKRCKKWKSVRALAKEKLDAMPRPEGQAGPATEARRRSRQAQLCKLAERLAASDEWDRAEDELRDARAEWASLGDAEETLARRFERALARFSSRREEALHQARARKTAVAPAAPAVEETVSAPVESDADRAERELRAGEQAAERQRRDLERAAEDAERAAERQRRDEQRAHHEAEQAAERQRRDEEAAHHLQRLEELTVQLEALSTTDDRRRGEKALKDAQAAIQSGGPLPRDKQGAARARFQAARDKLHIRVQELRDTEDWKRWSNVPLLEALCLKMEALLTVEDLKQASADLRALQAEWKNVGGAPKEKSEALWARFKAAGDQVYERTKVHFAQLDEDRAANLKKKEELAARVEALAESSDWKETAETIKALQEEWKGVGPSSKAESDAVWQRFRGACDKFFERRKAQFAKLDEERAKNLERQEALCARVEPLAESTDWRGTAELIKAAQAEWKEIGPAPKDRADAVWQRFRSACDKFFDRRKAHFAKQDDERAANLKAKEALCVLAENLATVEDRAAVTEKLKHLDAEWQQIGAVPRDDSDAVWNRFRTACDVAAAPPGKKSAAKQDEPAAPPSKFENKLPLGDLQQKLAETDAGWTELADEDKKK